MRPYQTLKDNNNKEVALFPLEQEYYSQADNGTYSHGGGAVYWATDFLGYQNDTRVFRSPCYAPVSIELIYLDKSECMAVWQSINTVRFADDTIDYMGIIVYHDNDITSGGYSIGDRRVQGQIFNRTGTGGNVTGDHVHIEVGKGKWNDPHRSTGSGTPEYKYHFTDYTTVKRIHIYNALYFNDTDKLLNPDYYIWKDYTGGLSGDFKKRFPWVLYINKMRNNR